MKYSDMYEEAKYAAAGNWKDGGVGSYSFKDLTVQYRLNGNKVHITLKGKRVPIELAHHYLVNNS